MTLITDIVFDMPNGTAHSLVRNSSHLFTMRARSTVLPPLPCEAARLRTFLSGAAPKPSARGGRLHVLLWLFGSETPRSQTRCTIESGEGPFWTAAWNPQG